MTLNYKSFGEGFPLIIMHGMFGTLDNWQGIAKQLAKYFSVFILDLRNHGKSPHSEDFGYAYMCQDLQEFMQKNWIHRAHLIGHSMGGKVAMRFALEYGDMVEKLIVADIAPRAYVGNHQEIFEALFAVNPEVLESRAEAQEILKEHIKSDAVVQFLLKNLAIKKEGGFEWRMNLPVIHKHYREILGHEPSNNSFEGATLFLRGELSDYIFPEEMDDYRVYFPQAELKTIKGAGHWLHAEKPKEFLELSTRFLLEV